MNWLLGQPMDLGGKGDENVQLYFLCLIYKELAVSYLGYLSLHFTIFNHNFQFAFGMVTEWFKVLITVPCPLMVLFTLVLIMYQPRFVSWVFHVIFSFVHFISFDTSSGLRAFTKIFRIHYVFIQSSDCKSYINKDLKKNQNHNYAIIKKKVQMWCIRWNLKRILDRHVVYRWKWWSLQMGWRGCSFLFNMVSKNSDSSIGIFFLEIINILFICVNGHYVKFMSMFACSMGICKVSIFLYLVHLLFIHCNIVSCTLLYWR